MWYRALACCLTTACIGQGRLQNTGKVVFQFSMRASAACLHCLPIRRAWGSDAGRPQPAASPRPGWPGYRQRARLWLRPAPVSGWHPPLRPPWLGSCPNRETTCTLNTFLRFPGRAESLHACNLDVCHSGRKEGKETKQACGCKQSAQVKVQTCRAPTRCRRASLSLAQ